jgi:hypothetical protein
LLVNACVASKALRDTAESAAASARALVASAQSKVTGGKAQA